MSVSINYIIKEEVMDVNDVLGGITVTLNGESIARVVQGDDFKSRYSWKPEYLGQYIQTDFQRLVKTVSTLAEGRVDTYQVKKIPFPPSRAYLVLEPLSAEKLRVAYRIQQPSESSDKTMLAAPQSACGYVVNTSDFCRAVSEGARTYITDLRSMPLEWGIDLLEEFETAVNELDIAIEKHG